MMIYFVSRKASDDFSKVGVLLKSHFKMFVFHAHTRSKYSFMCLLCEVVYFLKHNVTSTDFRKFCFIKHEYYYHYYVYYCVVVFYVHTKKNSFGYKYNANSLFVVLLHS